MSPEDSNPQLERIRERLIALLDDAEYRVTKRALDQGLPILRGWGRTPTEWGLVEYILERLRQKHPIREAPQGDPPGCRGMGYVLKNADGSDLYIKLMIVERAF